MYRPMVHIERRLSVLLKEKHNRKYIPGMLRSIYLSASYDFPVSPNDVK